MRKPTMWVLNLSDTNWPAQSQNQDRILTFRINEEEGLHYMYGSLSKNGAILVLDGFLASAMSEVCFFHV